MLNIQIYYKIFGKEYYPNNDNSEGGKFKLYCDENGFDESDVKLEMNSDANDCSLVEFGKVI